MKRANLEFDCRFNSTTAPIFPFLDYQASPREAQGFGGAADVLTTEVLHTSTSHALFPPFLYTLAFQIRLHVQRLERAIWTYSFLVSRVFIVDLL